MIYALCGLAGFLGGVVFASVVARWLGKQVPPPNW